MVNAYRLKSLNKLKENNKGISCTLKEKKIKENQNKIVEV